MTRLFAIATVFIVFITLGFESARAAEAREASRETKRENIGDGVPTIFDVRKSLPMEPTDPSYHDFYINAGSEAGFKKGQYLPVQRALPVHDPVQNKQQAILTVPVGKVLVIHVERNMTVARLVVELGDDERPTLDYEAIMIGDRIDMKGISMEAPKDSGKKKKRQVGAVVTLPSMIATIVEKVTPTAETVPSASEAQSNLTSSAVPVVKSESAAGKGASAPGAGASAPPVPVQPVKSDFSQQPSSPPRVTQPVPPPTA